MRFLRPLVTASTLVLLLVLFALVLSAGTPSVTANGGPEEVQLSAAQLEAALELPGWTGNVEAARASLRHPMLTAASTTDAGCDTPASDYHVDLAVGPSTLGPNYVTLVRSWRTRDAGVEHRWGYGFGGDYSVVTGCYQASGLASARRIDGVTGVLTATYGLYVFHTLSPVTTPVSVTYTLPFVVATPGPSPTVVPSPTATLVPTATPRPSPTPLLPSYVGGRQVVWLRPGFVCPVSGYDAIPMVVKPAGYEQKRLQCVTAGGSSAFVLP